MTTAPVFRHDSHRQTLDGIDSDGMLRGRGVLAKVGVYEYTDSTGNVHREFTPAETLQDADWLSSLKIAPVTLGHPQELVTADNVQAHGIGALGDSVIFADDRNLAPLRIMRADGVAAVQRGVTEISCGYYCTLDATPGVWDGKPYDAVQRSRRANHVAIVTAGRHGATVRLLLDGAAQIVDAGIALEDQTMPDPIKTDAAKCDNCDKLQAKIDEMSKEMDEFKAKAKEAKGDEADAQAKADAAKVQADAFAAGKARAALEAHAANVCGDQFSADGKDDRAVRVAMLDALGVTLTDSKATDDSYIAARLDVELASRSKTDAATQIASGLTTTWQKADAVSAVPAHLVAIAEMQARQRGEIV